MTELPIQISRLPVSSLASPYSSTSASPKLAHPSAKATGSVGFKLSMLTPRKPSVQCCLVFRNFYVAWLRIVQINVDGSSTDLASAYPLMKHVHYEDDAQNWQIVKLSQLPVSWNPHIFDSLCVYLSQPSPLWKTWELHDVKFYELPQESDSEPDEALAATRLGSTNPPKLEHAASLSRNQSAAEARLTQLLKRQFSRPILAHGHTGVNSGTNSVEERATRCLDLVLRLRELLGPIQE